MHSPYSLDDTPPSMKHYPPVNNPDGSKVLINTIFKLAMQSISWVSCFYENFGTKNNVKQDTTQYPQSSLENHIKKAKYLKLI